MYISICVDHILDLGGSGLLTFGGHGSLEFLGVGELQEALSEFVALNGLVSEQIGKEIVDVNLPVLCALHVLEFERPLVQLCDLL